MTKINPRLSGSDLKFEFSDQVREQMESDPKMAELIRRFSADYRQAQQAVHDGKYETVEDALAAVGLEVSGVDLGDEE
jgi:hypothetical protein